MKEELIQNRIRRLFEAKEQQKSPFALKETDRSIKIRFNAKDTYEIKVNEKNEYVLEKNGEKVRYNELPKEEQKLIRGKIEKGHVIFAEKEKEPERETLNTKKTLNKENKKTLPEKGQNKEKEEQNKASHTQTLAQQERRRQLLEQKKKEERQRAQAEQKAVAAGITAAALQQVKYHSYDDIKTGLDSKGLPAKYMEVGEALNEIADCVSLEGQEKGGAFLALDNKMSFVANEKGDIAIFMDSEPVDEISSVLKISSETIGFTKSAEIGLSDFSGISLEHSESGLTGAERL